MKGSWKKKSIFSKIGINKIIKKWFLIQYQSGFESLKFKPFECDLR